MTLEEFEKLVAAALKDLPEAFREKMNNVAVVVADAPTSAQARRFGTGLMGLYEGIPLADRTTGYSGAMPDKITIFRKSVEAVCATRAEIPDEVRHVVMHEIAHHFGIDDDELKRKGLY